MRLIDSDDVDNHIVGSVNLSGCPTINAIPIPEDATNGDVIKAMFPNLEVKTFREDSVYSDEVRSSLPTVNGYYTWHSFDKDWWNAKYKVVNE